MAYTISNEYIKKNKNINDAVIFKIADNHIEILPDSII